MRRDGSVRAAPLLILFQMSRPRESRRAFLSRVLKEFIVLVFRRRPGDGKSKPEVSGPVSNAA